MADMLRVPQDDAAKQAVCLQQFSLWMAAAPRRNATVDKTSASQSGDDAFSSLYFSEMKMIWDLMAAAQKQAASASEVPDAKEPATATRVSLTNLRLCPKPQQFWLAMMQETPTGASPEAIQAHRAFCKAALDIVSIVGHTAGVERAGKGYNLVQHQLRRKMDPVRAAKCIYIYENYGLLDRAQVSGSGYDDFFLGVMDEDEAASLGAQRVHALRRGTFIMDDVPQDQESEHDEDEDEEGDTEPEEDESFSEAPWHVPQGFSVAPQKPDEITAETVLHKLVFMKWAKFGWQLGRVSAMIGIDTPRLLKAGFNTRVDWVDGKGPCKLDLELYGGGVNAPDDSWVLLDKKTAVDDY